MMKCIFILASSIQHQCPVAVLLPAMQLILLRNRWHIILVGLAFQYVHGIFTQLAYRMHKPTGEPLHDVGFDLIPVSIRPKSRIYVVWLAANWVATTVGWSQIYWYHQWQSQRWWDTHKPKHTDFSVSCVREFPGSRVWA